MGEDMTAIIDRMRKANQSRDYLLQVLALWDAAQKAGFDPSEVKAFTFRTEFLSKEEKPQFALKTACTYRRPTLEASDYHNCVRLHTGELMPIPLTKKPKTVD